MTIHLMLFGVMRDKRFIVLALSMYSEYPFRGTPTLSIVLKTDIKTYHLIPNAATPPA
jgi:hypothetical protein